METKRLKKLRVFLNTKEFEVKLAVSVVLLSLLVLSFFFAAKIESALGLKTALAEHQARIENISSSNYLVEYIDVGQGNCSFITLPDNKTILIDGGNTGAGETVVNFLKERGLKQLDFLIATHADSDHIGGLNLVLESFEVKNIYRPFQISGTGTNSENFEVYEHEDLSEVYSLINATEGERNMISRVTTNVYKEFIKKIYSETYTGGGETIKSSVTVFYDDLILSDKDYKLEFYAPLVRETEYNLSDYSNTNGYATLGYGAGESNGCSAIFSIKISDEIFLFTGDAPFTSNSEKVIPESGYEELDFVLSLTEEEQEFLSNTSVFLAGHHGSKFSSGEVLLQMINPKFVVVSAGKNNEYKHPNEEAVKRLNEYKECSDSILQTSIDGTITFGESDGKLMYVLEKETDTAGSKISWYLLGSLIFIALEVLVISIRFSKSKRIISIPTDDVIC